MGQTIQTESSQVNHAMRGFLVWKLRTLQQRDPPQTSYVSWGHASCMLDSSFAAHGLLAAFAPLSDAATDANDLGMCAIIPAELDLGTGF